MYEVKFTATAKLHFSQLEKKYQSAAAKAIDHLAVNPKIGDALQGTLKGYWRLRFSSYRIIYTIRQSALVVIVFEVAHRREVYKRNF
ncbi:MAG: type II toxin-antitoxin system RelE/ParE family toxin [Patescibacteria group bacterium]